MSKKGREEAAKMVEDAVAKAAKKTQADKNLTQAQKDQQLAANARAADAVRKKLGTE